MAENTKEKLDFTEFPVICDTRKDYNSRLILLILEKVTSSLDFLLIHLQFSTKTQNSEKKHAKIETKTETKNNSFWNPKKHRPTRAPWKTLISARKLHFDTEQHQLKPARKIAQRRRSEHGPQENAPREKSEKTRKSMNTPAGHYKTRRFKNAKTAKNENEDAFSVNA